MAIGIKIDAIERYIVRYNCTQPVKPFLMNGVRGLALDVRGERGESPQVVRLDDGTFSVVRLEVVPDTISRTRRVLIADFDRDGIPDGLLVEGMPVEGKLFPFKPYHMEFERDYSGRLLAFHAAVDSAWTTCVPDEIKKALRESIVKK